MIWCKISMSSLPFPTCSVQLLSHVWLLATPWIAAHQASRSITNFQSSLRLTSIKSVMPSSHLMPCHPLLLLPSIYSTIRVFANESVLCIRWPKYWSFSFCISPSNEYLGLISLWWTGWISLQSKGLSRVFSITTVQKHQFFGIQFSSIAQSCLTLCDPMDCRPPGSSVHRILRARVLEWGAITFSSMDVRVGL